MFRGRSYHKFNADGRLQLPIRFVEALHTAARSGGKPRQPLLFASLTDYYVQLRYVDHKGIVLYPKRPKRRVPPPTENPTSVLTVDKRGRIRLPQQFFEYLGAGKNPVVAVGMLARIELWPEQTWEAEFAKAKAELNRDASLGSFLAALVDE